MSERALVTGLGVVAPNGIGVDRFWSATLRGESAIDTITRFDASGYPVRLAGEIRDFDMSEYINSRLVPQTDHMTRLALAASDMALSDARIDPATLGEFEMGVVSANASGGFEFGQRELQNLWSKGPQSVSAYQSFAWFYAVNTGQISIRHRMRGPCGVLVSEQAGGLDSIAEARRHMRRGTKLVLTGGVDASICPWGLCAQIPNGRLSRCDRPEAAFAPFDVNASGHVPGEGGAIIVLETASSANERGSDNVYGEIAGYAATFDPRPGSGRQPGLRRAAQLAMQDAEVQPNDVDVVFADAMAVPELDRVEAEAIIGVFGPQGVPVTAPKTMIGRLYSGGAPVDVAAGLLALRDQVIPPTVNVSDLSGEFDIDLVINEAREAPLRTALVLARGYGGFNSAMVLRAA